MLSNELLSALASQGAAFALILYVLSRDVGTAGCQGDLCLSRPIFCHLLLYSINYWALQFFGLPSVHCM